MWKVISPRVGRESAQRLQQDLNEDYPIQSEKIINWGNSSVSNHNPIDVFGNKFESVARSANKHIMFKLCKGLGTVPILDIGDSVHPAGYFIHSDPFGHNGSGVRFTYVPGEAVTALSCGSLVTKKIKGTEFRTYFSFGEILGIFEKVLVEGNSTSEIHNSHNGWGYLSNPRKLRDITGLKQILKELTLDVASALELSYGAVDCILEDDTYKVYILESNTAPTLFTNDLVAKMAHSLHIKYGEK